MVLIKLRAEGMVFAEGAIDFNHALAGSNVLYMDGHVEFIRYPAYENPCSVAHPIIAM